jgi:hypothetical protein
MLTDIKDIILMVFKIGDKVRVVLGGHGNEPSTGKLGIVKAVAGVFLYINWEIKDTLSGGWYRGRFEVINTISKQLHFMFK